MQANDRREDRLDQYLGKHSEKQDESSAKYVDIQPEFVGSRAEDIVVAKPKEAPPASPLDLSPQAGSEAPMTSDQEQQEVKKSETAETQSPAPRGAAPLLPAQSKGRMYIVKAGDTLGTIASREMGSSKQWQTLLKANQETVKDPRSLKIGMKLSIPEVALKAPADGKSSAATAKANEKTPKSAAPLVMKDAAPLSAVSEVNVPENAEATVERAGTAKEDIVSSPRAGNRMEDMTVKEPSNVAIRQYKAAGGESLMDVAKLAYKDENRWRDILSANHSLINNPRSLAKGTVLRLPD